MAPPSAALSPVRTSAFSHCLSSSSIKRTSAVWPVPIIPSILLLNSCFFIQYVFISRLLVLLHRFQFYILLVPFWLLFESPFTPIIDNFLLHLRGKECFKLGPWHPQGRVFLGCAIHKKVSGINMSQVMILGAVLFFRPGGFQGHPRMLVIGGS